MTFARTGAVVALCDARCIWAQKSKSAFLPSTFLPPSLQPRASLSSSRLGTRPGTRPILVPSNPSTYCPYPGRRAASILACAVTRISVGMPSAYVDSSWV